MADQEPLQIFRTGRHVASSGEAIDFTAEQLRQAAEAYDPSLHEAPLVVGHPAHNAPAYGWVKALRYNDDTGELEADPAQVDEQFAELVRAGRYKKVSPSFYPPDHPANPKPGVFYVRHVGFLGAQPPAVKGMRDAAFGDDGTGTVDFVEPGLSAMFLRGLREFFIERFGTDPADSVVPESLIQIQEDEARAKQPEAEPEPGFAEQRPPEEETVDDETMKQRERDLAEKEHQIAEREQQFAEREQQISQQEAEAKRQQAAEFVERLVREGRVLPRDQEGLVAFMSQLDGQAVVQFGEGDNAENKPATEWLQTFLAHLPPAIDYQEAAGRDKQKPNGEPDPKAIAAQAAEFVEAEAQKGRTVSYTEAVRHVTQGGEQ